MVTIDAATFLYWWLGGMVVLALVGFAVLSLATHLGSERMTKAGQVVHCAAIVWTLAPGMLVMLDPYMVTVTPR